jgi:hypothetical protein
MIPRALTVNQQISFALVCGLFWKKRCLSILQMGVAFGSIDQGILLKEYQEKDLDFGRGREGLSERVTREKRAPSLRFEHYQRRVLPSHQPPQRPIAVLYIRPLVTESLGLLPIQTKSNNVLLKAARRIFHSQKAIEFANQAMCSTRSRQQAPNPQTRSQSQTKPWRFAACHSRRRHNCLPTSKATTC